MPWTVIISPPGRRSDPPWDDPAAIRRHIVETLPGATFSGPVGSFAASTYAMTFTLADDGGAIDVDATDQRAEAALIRVVQRAGWQAVDQYVAHPSDPAGRAMAVFTDGAIRVATGRVPVRTDPLLRLTP